VRESLRMTQDGLVDVCACEVLAKAVERVKQAGPRQS
jgi:hypothetical protein